MLTSMYLAYVICMSLLLIYNFAKSFEEALYVFAFVLILPLILGTLFLLGIIVTIGYLFERAIYSRTL